MHLRNFFIPFLHSSHYIKMMSHGQTMPAALQIKPRSFLPIASRRHVITYAAASPTTTPPPFTEKDVKTGTERAVSFSPNGSFSISPAPPSQCAPATVRSFFLPQGWPHSVTRDYLEYQIWTFPSHVTGWMSHSLAGSSMLKALGIDASASGAVGFSAAIKWVTKDGVGAVGRLFVGGKLSSVFDEDPKRWRMIAEAITTLGLALEIATQLSPSNFVTLAGAGTLAKATGRGMGRPCFRVVQTHFATTNNVGDVSAKEEVWEVAAQMAGLAASVALLSAVEAAGTPEAVVPLWAGIHSLHVVLRYYALTKLRFTYPNYKRGAALVLEHVKYGKVLTLEKANSEEAMFQGPEAGVRGLKCVFGCSLEQILKGISSGSYQSNNNHSGGENRNEQGKDLEALIELYRDEKYMLTWHDGTAQVLLWEGGSPLDMLRALWQAAWLHHESSKDGNLLQNNDGLVGKVDISQLSESLNAMQECFPDLEQGAAAEGWTLLKGIYPSGSYRLSKNLSA